MLRRADPASWRAAWWAHRSLRVTRRQLATAGVEATVPAPPRLPERARRGVVAVLAREPSSCLERALVLQCWLAAQGQDHDVVIGVPRSGPQFPTHAWVDGVEHPGDPGYLELHRLSVR